jgi:Domain of unknown function (DUF4157)
MQRDGSKQDGLKNGVGGERDNDVQQQRPAPGKATRTGKLPESRDASSDASRGEVQRKAGAANAAVAPARSSAQWTDDPQIDAAHRGLSAVQARGNASAEDPFAVHDAAAAGVSGAGSALPHFDRIQAAFGGAHDLGGVRAHVGGEAGAASEQIGAEAYATGNHIAFRGQPDLHTAAHEAAHVVQQRAGVQLQGGVGKAGDAYERQADAVADSVVRGESASALLGGVTGAASPQAVQKQERPPQGQQPAQQPGQQPAQQPAGQQTAGPAQQPVDVNALIAALQITAPALGTAPSTLDIAAALTWIENVQQGLRAAIVAHDALPADHADRARLAKCITNATQTASAHMTTLATSIKTQLQTLMQNSSPVEETSADGDTPVPPATPTLPAVPDVDRLRVAAAGLSRDAQGTSTALIDTDKQLLAGAAGGMADAALAIYQSHGVLGARTDWVTGFRQSTIPSADAATQAEADKALRGKQGAKDGLNAVFDDSGFNRYGAQAIMTKKGWQPHDWCGMFVVRHLFRSAGLDAELRAGFLEVGNVKDFFNYTQIANASRIPVTVWVPEESKWMDLREYHRLRGSERTWTPRATIQAEIDGGGAPFRSGDTLLINHSGGNVAQHIVMVDSYDATTGELRTIEGNTLGIRSNAQGAVSRTREGEIASDSGETSVGIHVREMKGDLGEQAKGAYQNKAGNTVLGCGRMSVADFENHRFSTMPIGSFPKEALTVGPEDMKAAAQTKNKVMRAQERGPAGRQ